MSYEIRAMSFAEILDTGFRLIRNHTVLLVGIAAVLYVPLAVIQSSLALQVARAARQPGLMIALSLGLGLVAMIGTPLVSAAVTSAVGEVYVGRAARLGRSLRTAWSIMMPLAGTMLLYFLILAACGVASAPAIVMFRKGAPLPAFGLILVSIGLIVYLTISFLLLWQVMVLEHTFGRAALRRSRELMRGNLLRGAALIFLGGLIVAVLTGALRLALGYVPILGPIGSGLAQAAGVAYTSAVFVVLYFDIRCRKEAFDLQHLAGLVAARDAGPTAARIG